MTLTGAHYIYILFMVIVLVTMIMKKDVIIPCILGIFCLGLFYTHNIAGSLGAVFNSFIVSLNELGSIILIISIMVALSKTLETNKAINYMVKPFSRFIKNPTSAFFVTGLVMLLLSWFFWPTPAVALVGAVFLPVALNAGLPAIGVAVALNLFGHGLALSTDFVIQGAPAITAGAAGIEISQVIQEGMPLYWVMAIVTIGVAFYGLRKDIKKGKFDLELQAVEHEEITEFNPKAKIAVFLVLIVAGINVAMRAKDKYGRLLATGIISVIAVQVVINIAVVTGSMPVTGVPLPFISYGGTSLVFNLAAIGVLLNISSQTKTHKDEMQEKIERKRIKSKMNI